MKIIPPDESLREQMRQCIAFFLFVFSLVLAQTHNK